MKSNRHTKSMQHVERERPKPQRIKLGSLWANDFLPKLRELELVKHSPKYRLRPIKVRHLSVKAADEHSDIFLVGNSIAGETTPYDN